MFFKYLEDYDAKQHRGIIRGAISMRTRGKVWKYVALKK